jgi:hypothetical protein
VGIDEERALQVGTKEGRSLQVGVEEGHSTLVINARGDHLALHRFAAEAAFRPDA